MKYFYKSLEGKRLCMHCMEDIDQKSKYFRKTHGLSKPREIFMPEFEEIEYQEPVYQSPMYI